VDTTPEADLAAELAPHIDRLALCIHRPASTDPELRAGVEALQLPAGSMLVVAARYLTHDGLRPGDVATLTRYQPAAWATAIEQEHVRRGLLTERAADGVLVPSPLFRDLAATVLRAQADAAREVWSDEPTLTEAAATAGALVDAVRTNEPLPAFRRQVETRPPTPHGAARLLAAVTELRYLRADVHADALDAAGVRPKQAIELTKRWKGFGDPLPPDEAGRRAAIEAVTNRRVAAVLSADDLLARFLALATTLPGDDPRPAEDR
jgi:hypothetical protein